MNIESSNAIQNTASDPKYSIWLNAGAGTGKTKVLVDRVLRLILDNVSWDAILCITFTNAAAMEMKERIVAQITQWSKCPIENLQQDLTALCGEAPSEQKLSSAASLLTQYINKGHLLKIYTIHSLCQYILQQFTGGDSYQIIDQANRYDILQDIKQSILSNDTPENILSFLHNIHDIKINDLIEDIIDNSQKFLRLIGKVQSSQQYSAYLNNILGLKDNNITKEQVFDIVTTAVRAFVDHYNNIGGTTGDQRFVNACHNFLSAPSEERFSTFIKFFIKSDGIIRQRILSKKLCDRYPTHHQELLDVAKFIVQFLEIEKSTNLVKMSSGLLAFAECVIKIYQNYKAQNKYLDYDDLIINAKNLLDIQKDSVLYRFNGGLQHILLDEAQDTNIEQWNIIDSIIANLFIKNTEQGPASLKTIFVVGDDKQSIYGFQGASEAIFYDRKSKIKTMALDANMQFLELDLQNNYRSTYPILQTVKYIFSALQDQGDFIPNSNVDLQCTRHESPGNVVYHKIPLTSINKEIQEDAVLWQVGDNKSRSQEGQLAMAKKVAAYIKHSIDKSMDVRISNKPLCAGDFMVLVRRRGSFSTVLDQELHKVGLYTNGIDRFDLKDNLIVLDLIALAKFILLPHDDLNLACLLKSSFCSLGDQIVHEIAYKRHTTIWQEIQNNQRFTKLHTHLKLILTIGQSLMLREFFHTFVDLFYLRDQFSKRQLDIAAVDELLNVAYQFSYNTNNSLYAFVLWFSNTNFVVKQDATHSKDCITVMTIHGAKGLQAPIVILADCHSRSLPHKMFIENNDGLIFWNSSQENANKELLDLKQTHILQSNAEDLRLLYVAITRAQDQFIMLGIENTGSWGKIFDKHFLQIPTVTSEDMQSYILGNLSPSQIFLQHNIDDNIAPITNETPINNKLTFNNSYRANIINNVNYAHDTLYPYDKSQNNVWRDYGLIVHKILEDCISKPSTIPMHPFLQKIPPHLKNVFISKLHNIFAIPEFIQILQHEIRREVPIFYKDSSNQYTIGKIDLLSLAEDKIYIVDYKTSEYHDNNIPVEYIDQLTLYYQALSSIYSRKKILCYILWIMNHRLVEIKIQNTVL